MKDQVQIFKPDAPVRVYIELLENEISRLTAGEWSTDDMVDCWMASAKRELTLLAYLAARRQEKEGKV